MNIFKKVISSVAAAAVSATMLATPVFAKVPNDVIGTDYEESAAVLGVLGVMVGDAGTGSFRPNDPIIRSEVTKVGVTLMGLNDAANSSNHATKYPDVVENHWANGFINIATNQGMVEGDDVGTFRPDEQIKFAEAAAIMVRALGYEPQAESKGGYPSGYTVTASNIGLTKGVSASANDLINRGEVAKMAYNALTIKMMEQTGFGTNVKYEVVDKTLLKDKLDVDLISGNVQAVGSSSLNGASNLEKDEIMINDTVYKTGSADVRSVLGFYVDAYIKNDSKTKQKTLLLALPVESMNTSVSVQADDIEKIVNTESEKALYYWKNQETSSKSTKAAIAADAKVMYNGKAGTFEDFTQIDEGSIVLLDSNKDGSYDVVFVNKTVNYVVEETVVSSNKLVDKYGQKTLVLDPDDKDLSYVLEKDNEKIELKDLNEWDVVTFTISKDEKLVYGIVSADSVTGTVTEKQEDKVFVNGNGYKIASNYTDKIALRDEATFYLDCNGKIAAADYENTLSSNYAYLANIGLSTGMDKNLEFKLFTKSGETVKLNGANKIKVNKKSSLTAQEALNEIKGERDSAAGQLITYEVNSNNEVYKVNTYKESAKIDKNEFKLNLNEKNVVYKAASGKLTGSAMSINVTDETIVFDIPEGNTDTKDYAIRNKSFFADDNKYDIMAFDVTEEYNAKVIIVTNSTGKTDEKSAIAVVDKITDIRNDDGEDVQKLYAYYNGEYVSFNTTDSDILVKQSGDKTTSLATGDIIQFKTNSANEIDGITVLFDISTKDTEKETNVSDKMTTLYGKVTKKFSTSFNLTVGDGTEHNYTIGDAKVYVADTKKTNKKVTLGSAADIQKYDDSDPERVFVRIYDNVVQEIVIVK